MFNKNLGLAFLVLAIGFVGCAGDSKLAKINGKISINNQPVEKGSISFFPADGSTQVTGTEIIAGQYRSEIPVGESKVDIRVPRKTGSKKLYDTPDSPVQDTFEETLPAKYNEKTELRFTAKSGSNEKHWDLAIP